MTELHIPKHDTDVNAVPGMTLMDVMILMAKKRKVVIGLPLAFALAGLAISFVLPNEYRATVQIMPPQQGQSSATALLSQLGGLAGGAASIAGLKNPNDMYVGMLKSRTIADRMITRFQLNKVYDNDLQDRTRKELADNTLIVSGKDNLISISVDDKDKKRVAMMANAYVEELSRVSADLALTDASRRRAFYQKQLEQAKDNLATAEVKLKGALDTQGVISVDADSRALAETAGRMRATISAKEVQLNAMQAFVTPNNHEYKQVSEELQSLRAELSRLENGSPRETGDGKREPSQSGLANIKILRDVKYFQMLYELLAKQYEVARLDEAKDPFLIQVLDQAIEPERKFKPKRTIIVLISGAAGLLAALAWAFAADFKARTLAQPSGAARWRELQDILKR